MARYNEILVGRYNRFLQKFLSMKGGPPAPQLSSEIGATWTLFHGVENRYLEGWERFAGNGALAAAAANGSGVRLRNPAGSNVMAVIERLSFSTIIAETPFLQFGFTNTVDLATIVSTAGNKLDNRGRPNPTLILSQTNATAGVVPALDFTLDNPRTSANGLVLWINDENQELTLLPGATIQVVTSAVNQDIQAAFVWRERLLEESERT
jgi:hypothetical protein